MKKVTLLLAFAAGLFGQQFRSLPTDPVGSCTTDVVFNFANGKLWGCSIGVWTQLNTSASGSLVVGTTTITSGTTTKIEFNNAGVLGEYTISGTGNVAMTTSPVFTTPNLGVPSAVTLTNGTGLPISTGVSGLGTGVGAALAVNTSIAGGFPKVIATGSTAMGTSLITTGACATVVTAVATGATTGSKIYASPSADPTGITGYAVSATGSLYIAGYTTADTANFKVCNGTSGSLTPGALTLNWFVF